MALILESFSLARATGEKMSLGLPTSLLGAMWTFRLEEATKRDVTQIFESLAQGAGANFQCRTRPDKFYIGSEPAFDRIVPVEILPA